MQISWQCSQNQALKSKSDCKTALSSEKRHQNLSASQMPKLLEAGPRSPCNRPSLQATHLKDILSQQCNIVAWPHMLKQDRTTHFQSFTCFSWKSHRWNILACRSSCRHYQPVPHADWAGVRLSVLAAWKQTTHPGIANWSIALAFLQSPLEASCDSSVRSLLKFELHDKNTNAYKQSSCSCLVSLLVVLRRLLGVGALTAWPGTTQGQNVRKFSSSLVRKLKYLSNKRDP